MEIEVKIRVESLEELKKKIAEVGAVLVSERLFEDNFLLDFPGRILKNAGCALRLRKTGGRTFLTFKGKPKEGERYKIVEEYETTIADGDAALSIFKKLGLYAAFRYQKYRQEYRLDELHILLDETPIGNFVEMEGRPEEIDQAASQLGFSSDAYITKSYPILYAAYCREKGIESDAMVFAGEE